MLRFSQAHFIFDIQIFEHPGRAQFKIIIGGRIDYRLLLNGFNNDFLVNGKLHELPLHRIFGYFKDFRRLIF